MFRLQKKNKAIMRSKLAQRNKKKKTGMIMDKTIILFWLNF